MARDQLTRGRFGIVFNPGLGKITHKLIDIYSRIIYVLTALQAIENKNVDKTLICCYARC